MDAGCFTLRMRRGSYFPLLSWGSCRLVGHIPELLVRPSVLYIGLPAAEKTNLPPLTDLHLMIGLAGQRPEGNRISKSYQMNQLSGGSMNASCWYSKAAKRSIETFHAGQATEIGWIICVVNIIDRPKPCLHYALDAQLGEDAKKVASRDLMREALHV